MNTESSFLRKREPDEVLITLFEQRKKWFIHSLFSAVESITSDKFAIQMFQVPSSKVFIPDRICEIVTRSIYDDRELYIKQLLYFLSQNRDFFELDELERIGTKLLNLSAKQIQIEIDQRNKIKQLSSTKNNLKDFQKIEKQKYELILHKLTVLNTFVLSVGQEMRAFKRRLPYLLGKFQMKLKTNLINYVSKYETTIKELKYQNKKLISQSSKIDEMKVIKKQDNEKMDKLRNSLSKLQNKYQKLKNEKSQTDLLNESFQKKLQSTQNELEEAKSKNLSIRKENISSQTELSKIKEKNSLNDSIQSQQSSEMKNSSFKNLSIQKENISSQTELSKIKEKNSLNDSIQSQQSTEMKKQIQLYEKQIIQKQQEIDQLKQIIQSHEEMTSKKFQNLIISQKTIKKLKDEFEKVSFVLNEIQKIIDDSNNQQDKKSKSNFLNEIINKIKFIKSKIISQNFESEIITELKSKCQQLMLTKGKVKQNFGDEINSASFKEISVLIEICTNLTVQDELHEVLKQLNEKIELSKISSESNATITKLFRQLNKKTKENQRLSVINQKLQNQKDDLLQQIGDIKMHLRQNPSLSPLLPTASRLSFSPSKSQNEITNTNMRQNLEVNVTPKAFTKSEVQFQPFDESASPIFRKNNHDFPKFSKSQSPRRFPFNNSFENDEGDDEGENELNEKEISQEKIFSNMKSEMKNNGLSILQNMIKNKSISYENSDYNQNEDFTLIQTLSALFDMNDTDEIPVRISNLMEKSEEFDHFIATLCSSLNIKSDLNKASQKNGNSNFENINLIMVQIQKLKFENKKMKSREDKIKLLFKNQVPSSQIPNEIAKIVTNMHYIQKVLRKENFDSYNELFENYYSTKKLNKAFIEREEMFRNYFPKYEFEKMPQLISVLVKENKKIHSVEREIEKVEPSITIYQAPKFIANIRDSFVKLMEKFCKIIFSGLKSKLNSENLIGNLENNSELINSVAKIEEMKILLPSDDAIDIKGFVRRIL